MQSKANKRQRDNEYPSECDLVKRPAFSPTPSLSSASLSSGAEADNVDVEDAMIDFDFDFDIESVDVDTEKTSGVETDLDVVMDLLFAGEDNGRLGSLEEALEDCSSCI